MRVARALHRPSGRPAVRRRIVKLRACERAGVIRPAADQHLSVREQGRGMSSALRSHSPPDRPRIGRRVVETAESNGEEERGVRAIGAAADEDLPVHQQRRRVVIPPGAEYGSEGPRIGRRIVDLRRALNCSDRFGWVPPAHHGDLPVGEERRRVRPTGLGQGGGGRPAVRRGIEDLRRCERGAARASPPDYEHPTIV